MHHAMGNWERAKTRTGIYYRYDSRTVFYWGSSYLYCMGVRIYILYLQLGGHIVLSLLRCGTVNQCPEIEIF